MSESLKTIFHSECVRECPGDPTARVDRRTARSFNDVHGLTHDEPPRLGEQLAQLQRSVSADPRCSPSTLARIFAHHVEPI